MVIRPSIFDEAVEAGLQLLLADEVSRRDTTSAVRKAKAAGANVVMALYDDDAGSPNNLLTQSGSTAITGAGRLEIDVPDVWLRAGTYWVMAVYDDARERGMNISFYTSKNLLKWKRESHIGVWYECPEIFKLPVPADIGMAPDHPQARTGCIKQNALEPAPDLISNILQPSLKGLYRACQAKPAQVNPE